MRIDSAGMDAKSKALTQVYQLWPTENIGSEPVYSACRIIGQAVGAGYVRFVDESSESDSVPVRWAWEETSGHNIGVLLDMSRPVLERTSIETTSIVSGEIQPDPSSPKIRSNRSSEGAYSGFAVPVSDEYGILGAIGVYFEDDRSDINHDEDTVEAVASVLAGYLRAVRRAGISSTESNTWRALAQIGQLVNASPRIEDAYDSVAKAIQSLLVYDTIQIGLVDLNEKTRRIEYVAGAALPEGWTRAPVTFVGSVEEEVVRSRTGLRVGPHNSQALGDRYNDVAELAATGFHSWLTVPLLWQSNPIGLLSILSKRRDVYSNDDLITLDNVGKNISGALANADLYRTIQRDTEERSIIAELSRTLSSSIQISEVYPRFAEQLKRLIAFDRLTISLLHPSTGTIQKTYVYGSEVPGWHIGRNYPPGPLTDLVISAGHGVIRFAGDTYTDGGNVPYEDEATNLGLLSALAVPLTVHNKSVGAMCLRSYGSHSFNYGHLQLAERVGAQIGGSMLAVQYQSALNAQINETNLLEKFICEALTATNIDAILDRTFETASKMLRFDRMVLGLIRPGITHRLMLYARGMDVPGNDVAGKLSTSDHDPGRWTGSGYFPSFFGPIVDVPQLSEPHVQRMTESGLTSWMHVPLAAGQISGYLAIQGRPRAGYVERHFRILDRIAYLLAHAVQMMMPSSSHLFPKESFSGESGNAAGDPYAFSLGEQTGSQESRPIKLLLIDDDPMYLAGLSSILGGSLIELVGAASWSNALAKMKADHPDVVLVSAKGDISNLRSLQSELNSESGRPILVIMKEGDNEGALHYLEAGAVGVLSRHAHPRQIIGAIEQAVNGHSVVESQVVDLMFSSGHRMVQPMSKNQLEMQHSITQRDRDILKGVASGHTNAEIAMNLNLAAGTVRNRLGELYAILEVSDRGAAVYRSMHLGIID